MNQVDKTTLNKADSLAVLTPAKNNFWAVLPEFKMQPGLSRLEREQPELFLKDSC